MVKRTRKHRGGETADEWMAKKMAAEEERVKAAKARAKELGIPEKYVPPPPGQPIGDTLFRANYAGKGRRSRRRKLTKRRSKVY